MNVDTAAYDEAAVATMGHQKAFHTELQLILMQQTLCAIQVFGIDLLADTGASEWLIPKFMYPCKTATVAAIAFMFGVSLFPIVVSPNHDLRIYYVNNSDLYCICCANCSVSITLKYSIHGKPYSMTVALCNVSYLILHLISGCDILCCTN